MAISEQIALATIIYFGQVIVFCSLIKNNVLVWFLLIMCKEDTLTRSTKLLSRNHLTLCFWLRRYGRQLNLQPRIFQDSRFWNHTWEKSNRPVFINMNWVFLLTACNNSSVESFPYKYISCSGQIIWSNRVWGSRYLIIS